MGTYKVREDALALHEGYITVVVEVMVFPRPSGHVTGASWHVVPIQREVKLPALQETVAIDVRKHAVIELFQ